jgi:exosortase
MHAADRVRALDAPQGGVTDRLKAAVPAILTAAALALCYAPYLRGMADQWCHDEDMGHAFAVLPVIAWLAWRERERLSAAAGVGSGWGIALMAAGAALHLAGAVGAGLFAGSLGLLVSAAGATAALGGLGLLRALAFPFLLALFMLPKLAMVYDQVTLPLQLLASRLAAWSLTAAGLGVVRDGNILHAGGHSVAVEEACSGIRYLMPLGFLALVFGYLTGERGWGRAALAMAAIPLAILANALRVALATMNPALAAGWPHALSGGFIFGFCLAGLVALHGLSRKWRGAARG